MQALAISIGDPAGIGPEVLLRAAARSDVPLRVWAPEAFVRARAAQLALPVPAHLSFVDPGLDWSSVRLGLSDRHAGALQVASLEGAVASVLSGQSRALVTAPITKHSAMSAGFAFPGHTEFLAAKAGAEVVMMLAGDSLRVVPLTGHMALAKVPQALATMDVARKLGIVASALATQFALARPRIAVTGLNPHAGESGALGDEEQRVLIPAIEAAQKVAPAQFFGPYPADGLFARAHDWDAVICCYHDQALIPLKMRHPDDAINVTLGLPFVRTSPAHGSALDIAAQGVANGESMYCAIAWAAEQA